MSILLTKLEVCVGKICAQGFECLARLMAEGHTQDQGSYSRPRVILKTKGHTQDQAQLFPPIE